jgi:hypothetical protein
LQIVGTAYEIRELRQKDWLKWQTIRLRTNERGHLEAKFARLRVNIPSAPPTFAPSLTREGAFLSEPLSEFSCQPPLTVHSPFFRFILFVAIKNEKKVGLVQPAKSHYNVLEIPFLPGWN